MVEAVDIEPEKLADEKKSQGNEALKKGEVAEAVRLYSEAIELSKTEAMLTNRAMAYIKLRKYKEALLDCEQALYLNPQFAKAHLRAYTCNLY